MDANENEYAELLAKMPQRIHIEPWADFYEGSIPEADEYGDYSEGFMEYVRADVYQEASDLLKAHEAAWDELVSEFENAERRLAHYDTPRVIGKRVICEWAITRIGQLRPGAEESDG